MPPAPSTRAASAAPNQGCFRPALICVRPKDCPAALTTSSTMITVPSPIGGPPKPFGYQSP